MPKVKILRNYDNTEGYVTGDVVDFGADITALVDQGLVEIVDDATPLFQTQLIEEVNALEAEQTTELTAARAELTPVEEEIEAATSVGDEITAPVVEPTEEPVVEDVPAETPTETLVEATPETPAEEPAFVADPVVEVTEEEVTPATTPVETAVEGE